MPAKGRREAMPAKGRREAMPAKATHAKAMPDKAGRTHAKAHGLLYVIIITSISI